MTNEEQAKELLQKQMDLQLKVFTEASNNIISEKIEEYKQKQASSTNREEHKKGKSLNDFLKNTDAYTSNASTVNRSLALGGIAIIWIFKKNETTHIIEKGILNLPLLFLAISLALDLFQYFFGAIAWKCFYERKLWIWKKKKNYDSAYACDIVAPDLISIPIYIIWLLKIIAMIIAYYFLLKYLFALL